MGEGGHPHRGGARNLGGGGVPDPSRWTPWPPVGCGVGEKGGAVPRGVRPRHLAPWGRRAEGWGTIRRSKKPIGLYRCNIFSGTVFFL